MRFADGDTSETPILLDGGLATELERRGADLRDPLWSARLLIEDPEAIKAVHRAYFEAGADIAISASYQASFRGFAGRGIGPEAAGELMRKSVALAIAARDAFLDSAPVELEAREELETSEPEPERSLSRDAQATARSRRPPLVAASIGPYGAALADGSEYHGNYSASVGQLEDFHGQRLEVLANAGADLLAIETIPSLEEASILLGLLGNLPNTGVWISFTCRDAERVAHGERFAECVARVAASPQVLAIGLNCTAPRFVEPLLRSASRVTHKPLVAYPNRGEQWDAEAHRWRAEDSSTGDPRAFAELALRWRDAGARLIGGCCRTGPEHIRAMREAFDKQA